MNFVVRRRQRTWLIAAVVAVATGVALILLVGDLLSVGGADPDDRDWVRDQISQAGDYPIALPVSLPAGYRRPVEYGYGSRADSPVAETRNARFEPTKQARARGLRRVIVCVENADEPHSWCALTSDPQMVERRLGELRVVVILHDQDAANRAAWHTVALTTDVDKVSWLR